jgi:hypothetical protein
MNKVTISMKQPEQEPTLAGRLDGRRALVRCLESLPTITGPTLIILDFRGVELATASFLGEAVLHFRDHVRLGRSPGYLVVANLTERVAEELEDLLTRAVDALLACDISVRGEISNPRLIGRLDPKLQETFDIVLKRGESSAIELHSETNELEGIGPTAWNNRLSSLASKSLLMEVPLGRAKKYRPILESA